MCVYLVVVDFQIVERSSLSFHIHYIRPDHPSIHTIHTIHTIHHPPSIPSTTTVLLPSSNAPPCNGGGIYWSCASWSGAGPFLVSLPSFLLCLFFLTVLHLRLSAGLSPAPKVSRLLPCCTDFFFFFSRSPASLYSEAPTAYAFPPFLHLPPSRCACHVC
jgi:hypothetical protein